MSYLSVIPVCIDCVYGLSDRHPCVTMADVHTLKKVDCVYVKRLLTYISLFLFNCVYVWYCHEHGCMSFINTHLHIRLLTYTQATRVYVWYCHEHGCMSFINTHQQIRLLTYTQATRAYRLRVCPKTFDLHTTTCVYRVCVWTEWQASMCVATVDVWGGYD